VDGDLGRVLEQQLADDDVSVRAKRCRHHHADGD
jgi:hypothetical protein